MRFDVYKVELGMYPASIINFLSNDDTPPFRAGSVIAVKYVVVPWPFGNVRKRNMEARMWHEKAASLYPSNAVKKS
jgi:hypothetical protein